MKSQRAEMNVLYWCHPWSFRVLQPRSWLLLTLRAAVVLMILMQAALSGLAQNATDASTEHRSNEELRLDRSKTGAQETAKTAEDDDAQEALCLIVESAAKANDLPLEFFARVIWQESRFQSNAIGPLTRGGQRALG